MVAIIIISHYYYKDYREDIRGQLEVIKKKEQKKGGQDGGKKFDHVQCTSSIKPTDQFLSLMG